MTLCRDAFDGQARPLLSKTIDDGNYKALVDPRLEDNFVIDEMARMVACAFACIRHSARRRPKMTQVHRSMPDIHAHTYIYILHCYCAIGVTYI